MVMASEGGLGKTSIVGFRVGEKDTLDAGQCTCVVSTGTGQSGRANGAGEDKTVPLQRQNYGWLSDAMMQGGREIQAAGMTSDGGNSRLSRDSKKVVCTGGVVGLWRRQAGMGCLIGSGRLTSSMDFGDDPG
ncbi:hypothetical protein IAQ61_011957 [Plenodomus lingam]|uniref:uncharacterized protein n=1 Tax=Leptosphaeria maculans TaxID=5022 RepID=UPI003329D7D3|nr:hypothetical protein IAQ61_011957 [Plenodomus lingam]